jgi:GTP pyrophosphokinase
MAATLESILTKVRRYNPQADTDLLRRAHAYARPRARGPVRAGPASPYIQHPVEVVDILAGLEMDTPSLAAGFLHDVIEDCGFRATQLAPSSATRSPARGRRHQAQAAPTFERRDPGAAQAAETAREGARRRARTAEPKPDPRRKKRIETHHSADNLRKILLAMARDLRVMVIKLGDRLHNMRTLNGLPEERRKKVAAETMQIFAPLAHRLGIWQVKWLLEDLAFKYLFPDEYQVVTERVSRTRREREKDIRDAITRLKASFEEAGIEAEIQGRPKHLWSIYNKMRKQELDFDDIYDLIALRVITNTVGDCYNALGIVHEVWLPIPGKFDDYIAKRKSNLYQSLHTKVYGPRGEPLEIQIRTWEMHRVAEFGVAAHWAYKEKGEQARAGADFDRKMAFLRQQLFDWQQDAKDPNEFLRSVASDLFADQVFVFTPKGDVIDLPAGATPVDFAYRIHTDLGEHTAAAKVNGKIVPLSYKFANGDIASIVTRPSANPSLDWLSFVKTSHARSKIKSALPQAALRENLVRGREMLQERRTASACPPTCCATSRRLLEIAHARTRRRSRTCTRRSASGIPRSAW